MTNETKIQLVLASAVVVVIGIMAVTSKKKKFANLLDGGGAGCSECFDPQQAWWRCSSKDVLTQAGCGKNAANQQMLKCCKVFSSE